MKLFCIHCAGGSSKVFQSLSQQLKDQLEVIPVDLPGRGKRFSREYIYYFEDACKDLVTIIKKGLNNNQEEFALFGHSMGSLLSFEIAHLFQNEKFALNHVFLTGTKLPYQFENNSLIDVSKNDDEVMDRIKKLGGTPPDLLEHPYFLKLYLPTFKADFHLIGSYKYQKKEGKLNIPITVINGKDDPLSNSEFDRWSQLTKQKVEILMVDGGHFFLNEQIEFVSKSIRLKLIKDLIINQ
ncbi:thioesterase II family protein [Metabacillus rhizolycopersici]|uniref:Alpha/beta fold hydrolase n=1 Tax=Metabacillus rhizolycopersici TaxID=2875709 RepID=A0ABS7UR30_9BACI|nr:alpha/beta fold hydrolase [Metabacillus rhizolycopersici]MBZ5750611.1 alpha/beta fold hydrolase [Metabacillus rhizolycopersici]